MTTETAQHTPGPWAAPGTDGGEWVICHTDKGGKRRTLAHAYNEQNARLIAAAPELLAALNLYFSDFSRFHMAASAAIAKAEGRP
jgi:hypothetical protein